MTSATPLKSPRTRHPFPNNLTDLSRFRKTVHGHDGSSRIVMVRKTDQRTFASMKKGEQPKLETYTRETIETFRGQRTEYKVTTEKKDEEKLTEDSIIAILGKNKKPQKCSSLRRRKPVMDFEQECLEAHNNYRDKHNVGPLRLNHPMCKTSQAWAEELVQKGVLEHSPGNKYGENIYCIQSSTVDFHISGEDPVNSWYKELQYYVFGFEPYDLTSGHFTQVVWKSSTELGVGLAKCGKRIIVVCNYYPPGNIVGEFKQNVPPVGGFPTVDEVGKTISQLTIDSDSSIDIKGLIDKHIEGNFEEDFLASHNMYRVRHGCNALLLDESLTQYAQDWADTLASKNILEHRKNCPYGENIYCMYSNDPNHKITGHTPVDTWYEEAKSHVYTKEPTTLKTGHFTQVIWKRSHLLGVGVSMSRQGYIYVVGNYSPAGNYLGEYIRNVPAPVERRKLQSASHMFDIGAVDTPSKASILADTGEYTIFQIDALRVHNEFRRRHGCPPLRLSKQLCQVSKEWADNCAKKKSMAHRPANKYGENIFSMYSSDYGHLPSPRDVVKKWYDEMEEYTFGAEKINYNTLHFTQVVWKNTTEFGIDITVGEKGYTYVVANYSPRGNVVGQFVANVPKSLKSVSKVLRP